jgi:hypothetical protein
MKGRSLRADTRNPLLALPAAIEIQALPPAAAAALDSLLLELSEDARGRAEKCWRKHKAPMAVYWKAVAVYAGHARRLCRQKTPKRDDVMNGPDMNEMPGQQMIHELIAFLAKHRGTRFVARNLSTGIFSFFGRVHRAPFPVLRRRF